MFKLKVNTLVTNEIRVDNINLENSSSNILTFYEGYTKYINTIRAKTTNETDGIMSLELSKQIEILKINEIDEEIKLLNKKRAQLLNNIASIEQEELKQRAFEKNDIKKLEKANKKSRILENINEEEVEPKVESTITDKMQSFSSQILPKNNIKHTQSEFVRNKSVRKITPILQNYYKPLSLINKYTLPTDDGLKLLDFDIPFSQLFSVTTNKPTIISSYSLSNCSTNTKNETDGNESNNKLDSKLLSEYIGHKGSITCLQYKSNILITGAKDAVLNVYNCEDKNSYDSEFESISPAALLDSHIDEVTCLSYDGHTLVSGSQDRTVRQWDLNKMCCVNTLDLNFIRNYYQVENTSLSSASITPGNNSYMTNSAGGMRSRSDSVVSRSASVFDFNAIMNGTNNYAENSVETLCTPTIVTSAELMKQNSNESSTSNSIVPSTSAIQVIPKFISQLQVYDAALATGTSDGVVRLWDIRAQRIMRQLPSNVFSSSGNISICDMKFDSHQLLTSNYSDELMIWDLRMGKVLKVLKIGNNNTKNLGVQFEIDKKKVVIKDNNTGAIYLYDRKTNDFVDWKEKAAEHDLFDVECIRLKGGYLLEGYNSGIVKSWAI
ncbi:WD40 repeat-like protein [Hanseniaspora valbyensis NRRL Y-1626]|uniref:WD40 repeat-like protein n=1 Tax=Hanseniaspora valbyensis NRRL Y-1626 TaxID=766949 RepID=A0A1B7TK60_9ASCO|nr:WD40 repeat-like protein [Hanseniaspora valbyensis NRRL Y-1626]